MECLFFVLRKKRKKWKVSVQLFANSGVVLGQTYVMSYLCKEIGHAKVLSDDGMGGENWTEGRESLENVIMKVFISHLWDKS